MTLEGEEISAGKAGAVMAGLWKKKHRDVHEPTAQERERQEQAAKAENDREMARGEVYKPPPERNVLGWDHRRD
ncbi:hypothetical protein [Streptomyces sp. NPDC049555]|uniref:hypothetical protein n=1 Tax=Streptomyces sp. NPDC049555 TaxID=3154930 RepID=UPI0034292E7F